MVLFLHVGSIGPGVVHSDIVGVFLQRLVDVDHLGIADVRAVLLERDTQYQYFGILDQHPPLVHQLDDLLGHILSHRVVQAACRHHDARPYAIDLGFLNEIVGVYADAMAADESW